MDDFQSLIRVVNCLTSASTATADYCVIFYGIAQVAADLVTHFEERNQAQQGKAMIVAMSREICVHLYNAIIKLRPDWHNDDPEQGAIKIVMTGSASDKALLRPIFTRTTLKNG